MSGVWRTGGADLMRIALRFLLLLAAAAGAAYYGWHVRLAFRVPERQPPIDQATAEEAWRWGLALMEEHGYAAVGDPTSRQVRSGPAPRDIYWFSDRFPFVEPHWRRQSESIDLEPVSLAPGECVGMLTRGGGDFDPPSATLYDDGRWWLSSRHQGAVQVLQLCLPPGAEALSLSGTLEVFPLSDGEFVNEGEVRWARFRGRMRDGDPIWLIGNPGSDVDQILSDYAERQPSVEALRDGLAARREAEVTSEEVLLVPHTLASYEKLLALFEAGYPEKVPNPKLVAPTEGAVPDEDAEADSIAAHVQEHTVFSDGSSVHEHASFLEGRVLVALDLDALSGCARVVLRRHADRAIPPLTLRIDDREPVELGVLHTHVFVQELCPETGFAHLVTHAMDDATYTVTVYVRDPGDALVE